MSELHFHIPSSTSHMLSLKVGGPEILTFACSGIDDKNGSKEIACDISELGWVCGAEDLHKHARPSAVPAIVPIARA